MFPFHCFSQSYSWIKENFYQIEFTREYDPFDEYIIEGYTEESKLKQEVENDLIVLKNKEYLENARLHLERISSSLQTKNAKDIIDLYNTLSNKREVTINSQNLFNAIKLLGLSLDLFDFNQLEKFNLELISFCVNGNYFIFIINKSSSERFEKLFFNYSITEDNPNHVGQIFSSSSHFRTMNCNTAILLEKSRYKIIIDDFKISSKNVEITKGCE